MPSLNLGVRMPDTLLSQIDARADGLRDRAETVRRDLERYYQTLAEARETLRERFSSEEACLVTDCCNGTLFDPVSIPMLWSEIQDGIKLDGLDEKWQVDGAALVAKLKAQSYAEDCALVDAVERFWNRVASGKQPDPRKLLLEPPRPERAFRLDPAAIPEEGESRP